MKTTRGVLLGLLVVLLAPLRAQVTNPPGGPDASFPSAYLRRTIDSILPNLYDITGEKPPAFDRPALIAAQAEYSAKAQVAPPVQQPMYRAAVNAMSNLLGAIAEYEKAANNYHYSQNLHGKQDREDSKVSSPQRGWDAGAAGRANKTKQKMENDAARDAQRDKEQPMSTAAVATWKRRMGQIQQIVEQSYSMELISEKQLAATTRTTPPPIPVSSPNPPPAAVATSHEDSPAGTWDSEQGTWTLRNNGGFVTPDGGKGTWEWGDRTKRELSLKWKVGGVGKASLSADGTTLEVTPPKGRTFTLKR